MRRAGESETLASSAIEGMPLLEARGTPLGARPAEERAVARRDLYRFLAGVFLRPPEARLLRRIVDARLLAQLGSLFGGRAAEDLGRFAATARVKEELGSLRQEYMDLFAVPTGRYVTPFEDVYRGTTSDGMQGRGPLLGHRAVAVKRAYRAAGAQLDRACKALPTHVGVELSFMGFLCGREAASLSREESGRYRELQTSFLQEHLNGWFPQLSQAIQTYARGPLYRGLAVLTEEFLAWDSAYLTGEPRPRREDQDPPGLTGTQTE